MPESVEVIDRGDMPAATGLKRRVFGETGPRGRIPHVERPGFQVAPIGCGQPVGRAGKPGIRHAERLEYPFALERAQRHAACAFQRIAPPSIKARRREIMLVCIEKPAWRISPSLGITVRSRIADLTCIYKFKRHIG